MIQKHFEEIIRKKFGYDFSPTQKTAVENFIRFFIGREEEGLFLLRGFAGGKIFRHIREIVLTVFNPAGRTGGDHRQDTAVFHAV